MSVHVDWLLNLLSNVDRHLHVLSDNLYICLLVLLPAC